MTNELTCGEVHELAFEHRRNELGEPKQALVDEHLGRCSACAIYLTNLDELLRAAAHGGALPAKSVDALWERIEAALPKTASESQNRLGREAGRERRRFRWALAVGLLGALAWVVWSLWPAPQPGPGRTTDPEARGTVTEATVGAPTVGRSPGPADRVAPPIEVERPRLLPAKRPHLRVTVFADASAEWSFHANDELRIELESGTLLVAVLPVAEQVVVVQVPGRRIEVVGTVFLVAVEGGRCSVGVASGTLRVVGDDGLALVLEEGAELGSDGEVAPLSPERRAMVAAHVDLEAHRQQVAARLAAAGGDVGAEAQTGRSRIRRTGREARAEPSPLPETHRERADLFAMAEHAQREGRYGDATEILEALIETGALSELEIGLARLELARLYETRLGQHRRALYHLGRFLEEQPADPAVTSVQRELCRIASQLGVEERGCRTTLE